MGNYLWKCKPTEFEWATTIDPSFDTNTIWTGTGSYTEVHRTYYRALVDGMDKSTIVYYYLGDDLDVLELKDNSNAKLIIGLSHYFGLNYRDIDEARGVKLIAEAARAHNPFAIAVLARIRVVQWPTSDGLQLEPRFFTRAIDNLLIEFHDHPMSAIVNALRTAELGVMWRQNYNETRKDEKYKNSQLRANRRSYKSTRHVTNRYPVLKSLHAFLAGSLRSAVDLGCTAALLRLSRYRGGFTVAFIDIARYVSIFKIVHSSEFIPYAHTNEKYSWYAGIIFNPNVYEGTSTTLKPYMRLKFSMETWEYEALLSFNPAYRAAKRAINETLPMPIAEEIVEHLICNAANIARSNGVKRRRV